MITSFRTNGINRAQVEAQDKSGLDVISDSLLQYAKDYYCKLPLFCVITIYVYLYYCHILIKGVNFVT